MKIVTAITQDYKDLQAILQQATKRAGYKVDVTLLPDSRRVITPPGEWVAPSPWKPSFIMERLSEMQRRGRDELLVWVDGDVAILQNFNEVDTRDYDFAVTVRPEPIDWFLKINTGVLFFYPTRKSFEFLREWIRAVPSAPHTSDQYAINGLLENRRYDSFSADIYNFTTWGEDPPEGTKIVHCLTQYRAQAVEWVKSYLGDTNNA